MFGLLAPVHRRTPHPTLLTTLRHLGAAGLFFLAILDSSPIPTLGGPDILTAVLAASHRPLWWEYASAATAGSVVGAYLTFRLARAAGSAYLDKKFKRSKLSKFLGLFQHWGTGTLIASTAIPLPSPTSMFFAAAGAGDYPRGRFLAIVTACRAARYFTIAFVAGHYGRHFLRVLRHPTQHWGWIVAALILALVLVAAGILVSRRLETANMDRAKTSVQSPAI
ncbi:MAG TPA: VTT domain-containing protein [Candidatus Sulfotelmatobacter sp.]|nr:VTT domain-containing protein [Candidatus Sulfotelmatobacter sp.]